MKAPKKHTHIQRIKVLEQVVGTMWEVIKKQGQMLQKLDNAGKEDVDHSNIV
jgi:hypothetical protein